MRFLVRNLNFLSGSLDNTSPVFRCADFVVRMQRIDLILNDLESMLNVVDPQQIRLV